MYGGSSSPTSPGVLESQSLLDDHLRNLVQNPNLLGSQAARQELLRLYELAGRNAGKTVLERCVRILKEHEETLTVKLATLNVLNLLMDVNNGQLADVFASELKFFANLAKKSKEKEKRKRRPSSVFTSRASQDDIDTFLGAVCELLDRWGRHYQMSGGTPGSGGAEMVKVWKELQKDRVKFPDPSEYRYLDTTPVDDSGSRRAGVGTSPFGIPADISQDLSEPRLQGLANAVQDAMAQHGPDSMEVGEAKAHFESELALWQRAATEATERDDYAGFERYSEVAFRFAELGQRIETSPSASAATSRAASASASRTASERSLSPGPSYTAAESAFPGAESAFPAFDQGKKKHKKKRSSKATPANIETGFGNVGGGGESGQGGFGQGGGWPMSGDMDASHAADVFRSGAFGGSFGPGSMDTPGFGDAPRDLLPTVDEHAIPSQTEGSFSFDASGFGGPNFETDRGQHGGSSNPFTATHFGAEDSGPPSSRQLGDEEQYGSQDPPARERRRERHRSRDRGEDPEVQDSLRRHCGQLQAQVHQLTQQLEEARQGSGAGELEAARRRIRELEDANARGVRGSTCNGQQEFNDRLQTELDRCRQDLASFRRRASEAERRLADREEIISDTRQRLFEARQRITQLEDELTGQTEVQQSLQNRLQGVRAQQTATEVELRQVRHALSSSMGLADGRGEGRRGSVPYGFPGGSTGASLARPPSPSVNQADELAGSSSTVVRDLASASEIHRSEFRGLAASSDEAWAQTTRVSRPLGALLRRQPPSPELALHTGTNFRELLARPRGILYGDQQILMELAISSPAAVASGRPSLGFEVQLTNRSGQQIHDVRLHPASNPSGEQGCSGSTKAFDLRLESEVAVRAAMAAGGLPPVSVSLWPQQRLRFRGQLLAYGIFGAFDGGPQVELSYRLPDNMCLRAELRLPLAITMLMAPASPEKPLSQSQAIELWGSAEMAHAEVAVVCRLRPGLSGQGMPFSVWHALELGGALRSIPGLGGGPQAALLAGYYPSPGGRQQGLHVLLRAELRGSSPSGGDMLCRLAVRSSSHAVSRAVTQTALDVLCDGSA
eukprot:TRINITY_DN25872_c0_g1_i1.p1 TRINITY_DN25872_c0_g1~~TRINITY_DN25872_c0_g1_i1.p1  ORF type:complete len:1073 (+),score=187.38 TRINITY_DN25872_c0_g1_i1:33-3251(+)